MVLLLVMLERVFQINQFELTGGFFNNSIAI
jgi:hypothetical protein